MLSDIRYWEKKATEGHYAIPHFNVWNAEMLMGVIDAAEELRAPIIISFGTGFTGNTSFEDFCYMMDSMAKKATVPVIETGTGNCHVYVDQFADQEMAVNIIKNAKTQRIGVCNACESIVVHLSLIHI